MFAALLGVISGLLLVALLFFAALVGAKGARDIINEDYTLVPKNKNSCKCKKE